MADTPAGPRNGVAAPPPDDTLEMFQLGLRLHRQGHLQAGEAVYHEVLKRDPGNADALHLLGLVALQRGAPGDAAELITRAIGRNPKAPVMYVNRSKALLALGRAEAALADVDRALALQPDFTDLHLFRGQALEALGRWGEAARSYAAAIAAAPASAAAHRSLGDALEKQGELAGALAAYDRAIALDAGDAVALFNRANTLRALRRIDEAIAGYDAALALKPDFAVAHHNRAVCQLLAGRWAEGFAEYEWRKRCPDFTDPRYALGEALAPGADLGGKTLYIYPELFLGDVIQFCRYARLAETAGASVILAAPAALHELLRTLSTTVRLLDAEAQPDSFDASCALMSLPWTFGTTPQDAPAPIPYLAADPDRTRRMRARIGAEGLRIGVCWQGSTRAAAASMRRSFPLAALAGIAAQPGVRLISLQKHDGLDQLAGLPDGMAVETLGEDFDAGPDAFVDTAAAIAACDLVISADTAVAHLAGALGAALWLALPFVPDWRWGLEGQSTPWYPGARLFRQVAPQDWPGVFAAMAAALPEFQAGGQAGPADA